VVAVHELLLRTEGRSVAPPHQIKLIDNLEHGRRRKQEVRE
jgi:hypothetical protein